MAQKTESATIEQLLARLPREIATSFSVAQVTALEAILRNENGVKKHPVDMRMRFRVGNKRFYAVLLAGRESRPGKGRSYEMSRLAYAVTVVTVLALFSLQVMFLRHVF